MESLHVAAVIVWLCHFNVQCSTINKENTVTPYRTKGQVRNVLIFVGDDMGFELGIYNNSVIQTPNLDGLARRGVTFTQAFTSVSSCSPSRSAILTGLPQHQNGMYGLHHAPHNFNTMTSVRSLSGILRQHSVTTGIIGKKHVGPESVYPFDFAHTEETESLLQVGRNITRMKMLAREFLQNVKQPFLLYIGFADPHRCGGGQGYGGFCQRYGDGSPGMGVIPDWRPRRYSPDQVNVPYHVPDSPDSRRDIAAQYTSINRMDQGVGLILEELTSSGHVDNTLVWFTSDNGIPFPAAKTNLYTPGMGEPMIVSSPKHKETWGRECGSVTSLLDIVPTVLDWFQVPYPKYRILPETGDVQLTGVSILPLLEDRNGGISGRDAVFGSHDFHEVTMNYPMRTMRTQHHQLIHNLNFKMPYPIASDLAASLTYQAMMRNASSRRPLSWYRTLRSYYYRDLWELYDLRNDTMELHNLANSPDHADLLRSLKDRLFSWLKMTSDIWFCLPRGVLDTDDYHVTSGHAQPKCLDMHNGIPLF